MRETNKKWDEEIEAVVDKMRQWEEANRKATLTEIEEAVDAELSKLRKLLVSELANNVSPTGHKTTATNPLGATLPPGYPSRPPRYYNH